MLTTRTAARSVLPQLAQLIGSGPTPATLVGRKPNGYLIVIAKRQLSKNVPSSSSTIITRSHVTSSRNSAEATLAPEVTFENIRTLKKPKRIHLPKNIKFTTIPPKYLDAAEESKTTTLAELGGYSITHDVFTETTAARPLMLLFAWMLSKDKHIEKYREFWWQRGFDVMTVQTGPLDLLLPTIRGAKISRLVYDYLQQQRPRYDEIMVHAFSVGGYQFGEFLYRIVEGMREGDQESERLYDSLRGFVIDSCVFADDCAPGLSRAITLHPVWQPLIEKSIVNWLRLTKPFTLQRYYDVSKVLIKNERRVPAMLVFSEDDVVSNYKWNHQVVDDWQRNGTLAARKCWKSSVHVLHYKEHPEEYEEAMDTFVDKLDIKKRFANKVEV